MEVGVETNTPPTLVPSVPDAEVDADTAIPPTLVGVFFLLLRPTTLLLRAGAETDTPLSLSAIVSKDLPDRRRGCKSIRRRTPS